MPHSDIGMLRLLNFRRIECRALVVHDGLRPMTKPLNILFITADQWRAECLSALGHPIVG
jgi:hypothetical protein